MSTPLIPGKGRSFGDLQYLQRHSFRYVWMTKQEFSSVRYSLFLKIRKFIFGKTFRKSRKIKEILCFICYDMLTSTYFAFFKYWSSFKKNVQEKNNYRSVCTAASTLLMPDWSGRKNNLKTPWFTSWRTCSIYFLILRYYIVQNCHTQNYCSQWSQ